jgi:hypothetical protein
VIMPSAKVMFFVDAPTSKPKVVVGLLDKVLALSKSLPTKKFKVVVSAGTRLDLVSAVWSKMSLCFPTLQIYNVQLSHGTRQHQKRRPSYLLLAVASDSQDEVPAAVSALAARARVGEKTRLRCLDPACKMRPAAELDAVLSVAGESDVLPDCEMNPDDMEGGAGDVDMLEETSDALAADDDIVKPPPGMPGMIVDLWPFAFSREYYKHICQSLHEQGGLPNHVVYASTSAHPAPMLAAHDAKINAHLILDRVRDHSAAHGEDILRSTLFAEFYIAEKAKQSSGSKRLLSTELNFVEVRAPDDQPVCFGDVVSDVGSSAWRAGIDLAPASDDLERVVPALVAFELDHHPVYVRGDDAESRCLVASRALKDGDVIIPARVLLYSDIRTLSEFLNGAGAALADGTLVKLTNLLTATGDTMAMYAVMVGVCTYARDFRGKRARANAFLRVRPNIGANDGVLQLVVNTRNGCGIAAGSDILCDFGENYTPTSVPTSMLAGGKRFRGALDIVVARQLEAREADTLSGIGAVAGAGSDAAAAAAVQAASAAAAAKAMAAAKAEAAAAAAVTAAAAAAATAAAAAAGGAGAGSGRPSGGAVGALQDEVMVVENDQHTLVVDKNQRLVIRSKATKNSKVAPKTVLRLVTAPG